MDSTTTSAPPNARETDIAAAAAHLKESWEHGKEAASDAQRIARKSLNDLSRSVDQYFESRPRTIALWALGAGLAVGILTGLLVSRTSRTSSAAA